MSDISKIVCKCGSYAFHLGSDGVVVCAECLRFDSFKWDYIEICGGTV